MNLENWLERWSLDPSALFEPNDRAGWPHQRFASALLDGKASPADLAVLLRCALRSESIERGYEWKLKLPIELVKRLATFSQAAGLELDDDGSVYARRWRPKWLADAEVAEVDESVRPTVRRPIETCQGDPILSRFNLSNYTSNAQRDALRSVLCAKPGDTLAICLPTGAGKSLCAFLPSIIPVGDAAETIGVSVIVVPTVALALDLEKRMQSLVGHSIAYRPEKVEDAEAIRLRCASGIQGPVIVSPESLVGAFLESLRVAARQNLIRHFVVDEAHMVLSWGDEFRPAFLRLAQVRKDLVSNSSAGLVTLLLSATLTDYHLRWLSAMFSEKGNFFIIHAARLRPEPAFWLAQPCDEAERMQWVEEAIFRLPRPTIVYTTKRSDCEKLYARFRQMGFARLGIMTGETPDDQRRSLLAKWSSDEIDVVVATSAFGLGVDKSNVRTVVHAQLPESVDRFYQDVGRAGRDGNACVSLLMVTPQDWHKVKSLSQPKFISTELGLERWRRMYQDREILDADSHIVMVDLVSGRKLDMKGDYNRNWNVRTLQLLNRAGALDFIVDERESYNKIALRPATVRHLEEDYWSGTVEPLRQELASDYAQARKLLQKLVEPRDECIANIFAKCYASPTFELATIRACGGCPACRKQRIEPHCGKILARRLPPGPFKQGPLGQGLSDLLMGKKVAFIGYPSHLSPQGSDNVWFDLLWWMANEGVRNFIAPTTVNSQLQKIVALNPRAVMFRHLRPPRDLEVTASQVTVVIIDHPEPSWWREFRKGFETRETPTILISPNDIACPEDAHRVLRNVINCPTFELSEWANRFVA